MMVRALIFAFLSGAPAHLSTEVLTEYDLAREPVYVIDDDVPMTLRLKILNQVGYSRLLRNEDTR